MEISRKLSHLIRASSKNTLTVTKMIREAGGLVIHGDVLYFGRKSLQHNLASFRS